MLRVGLSGCGAVSRLYYGPALRRLEDEGAVAVAGLFDPEPAGLAELAAVFPAARQCAGFEALLAAGLDLVVIASPPKFHASQTIAALESGVRVHCEKPLALSATDGARMLEAAKARGLSLTVGLMRRSFPAVRAIAAILERGTLGRLRSVDVFEGGPFDWPVRSPSYFSVQESGGGVLRDLGPHALDLLTGWFGEPELHDYRDDADGGVEANCRIELTCAGAPCTVRMSRDWARPNRYLFTGDRGRLAWTPYEPEHLELSLDGSPQTPAGPEPSPVSDFVIAFTSGLRDVLARVEAGAVEVTPRAIGLDTLELIDRCYAMRQLMDEPWRVLRRSAS